MASLSALSFLVIFAFLPDTEGRSSSGRMRISFRDAFSQPAVPAVLAFTAINAIARGALLVFMPLFAPEISVVPGEVGLILTASIFLMAIFQIPLGRMADRGSATKMILTGSIVSAGSLTLIPKSSSFLDLFFVASVNGLGSALMMPALMAITVKIGKKIGMGTSMGAYNTAMSLGMITAPLLGGVVMDAFSIGAVFLLGGGIGVGTTIPIYILTRRALRLVETDKLS